MAPATFRDWREHRRAFERLELVAPGSPVITMQIFLTGPKYVLSEPDGIRIHDAVGTFFAHLLEGARALPGVESAGLVSWLPEMGYNTGRRERSFQIGGRAARPTADFNAVSADYFKTLQIPLLRGRYLKESDDARTSWTAVVNQAFARRYWPGQNPIGKTIVTDGAQERPREIVTVVADVRQDALEKQPEPEIYAPYRQQPEINSGHGYQNRVHMNVVIRILGDPDAIITAVRKLAAGMDGSQLIYEVRGMPAVLADTRALRRLHVKLLELFAGIALFLSAVGVYGVVSQSVSERTAEIGLRVAIGASTTDIRRLIFGRAVKLVLPGLAIGLIVALLFNRVLSSLLFEITVHDPLTLAAASGLLGAVALGASWIPARRAMKIDPIAALRHE